MRARTAALIAATAAIKSEEHTSELQSRLHLVCRLLLEKKKYAHSRHSVHAVGGGMRAPAPARGRERVRRRIADRRGVQPFQQTPWLPPGSLHSALLTAV